MEELKTGKEMLLRIREVFPDQAIFFMVGNHEERLEKYMRVKAPELWTVRPSRLKSCWICAPWASM